MPLELFSQTLEPKPFCEEMRFALELLSCRPAVGYRVKLGYGCSRSETLSVPAADLRTEVEARVRDGSFEPGEANLYVDSVDGSLRLLLCHEADIHVSTEEPVLAEVFRARWRRQGVVFHEIDSIRVGPGPDPFGEDQVP